MEKLILYGNKAVARGMYLGLKNNPNYEVVAFTVDREYLEGERFCDLPIVPFDTVQDAYPPEAHKMFVAVGYVSNNKIKKERYLQSKEMGYQFASFVGSTSRVNRDALAGDHHLIGEYVVISPSARIGSNVTINTGCMIGEDVVIGDHCFFSGGVAVAGGAKIGACCYFGMGSIIRDKISIGSHCVIGAGALMLDNAEDKSVYVGQGATLLPIASDKLPLG